MLTIDLGTIEHYDSDSNKFRYEHLGVVRFEYSLKVVYDWEFMWKKPFLKGEFEDYELLDFYMRMALDPIDIKHMTEDVIEQLSNYVSDQSTATTFSSFGDSQNGDKKPTKHYTAEELYALMIEAGIPLEFENRNLNRLLVILKIISVHNEPPKKMSNEEILRQNRELNRQRRNQYKTKG